MATIDSIHAREVIDAACQNAGVTSANKHSGEHVVILSNQRGINLLNGKPVNTFVELDVNGVAVIELE